MRQVLLFIIASVLCVLLCSWGGTGHYHISYRSASFMPSALLSYTYWADSLAEHASDADIRKYYDDSESPRHYVNLELFPGFLQTGRIIEDVDSAYIAYGGTFLRNAGSLPYATRITYDSLVEAFRQGIFSKVIFFASDLGHYVADGHMPLHLTRNYDGQYTGQSGAHYRIESKLVNNFISQIQYSGQEIQAAEDVNHFIFQYIYYNFTYVDTLLRADSVAHAVSGTYYGNTYYNKLWSECGTQMTSLFCRASSSIATLILTAYLMSLPPEAPSISSQTSPLLIIPNPASGDFSLALKVNPGEEYRIRFYRSDGRFVHEKLMISGQTAVFPDGTIPPGIYMLEVRGTSDVFSGKIVITK